MRLFARRNTVGQSPVIEANADEQRASMRLIAAEALILQDDAAEVIRGVRARESLSTLSRRGGPMVQRFFCLRADLPAHCTDPELEGHREILAAILHHHAVLLSMTFDLLANEWCSDRVAEQIDKLDGFGVPAIRLEYLYAELRGAELSDSEDWAAAEAMLRDARSHWPPAAS